MYLFSNEYRFVLASKLLHTVYSTASELSSTVYRHTSVLQALPDAVTRSTPQYMRYHLPHPLPSSPCKDANIDGDGLEAD